METVRIQHTILLTAVLFGTSPLAAAQFQWRSAPAILNSDAGTDTKYDHELSVREDGAGNWVAVWSSYQSFDPSQDLTHLWSASSTDNGVTWTAPVPVDTNGLTDDAGDFGPALATDSAGTWVVVWGRDDNPNGIIMDYYVARSTNLGATWTTPVTLDNSAGYDLNRRDVIDIATDGSGNWIAVWPASPSGDTEIRVARSADDAQTWSAPATLNLSEVDESTGVLDSSPRIATDGLGNWIVVWRSRFEYELGDETDQDILFARSSNNGATWTYPAAVNPNAAIDTVEDGDPAIATDGLGRWIVTWRANNSVFGSDADILASTTTNLGGAWTTPAAVNFDASIDSQSDFFPAITSDGAGNWLVGWGKPLGGFNGFGQLMARSSDNGASWGQYTRINDNFTTPAGTDLSAPEISTDGAGTWMVFWPLSTTGGDLELYYSRWNGILAPDRDGDNLSDSDEITAGTSSNTWDTDGDSLSDEEEVNTYNTSPLLNDTDGDGVWDSIEISLGTDPNDALDFPLLPVSWKWLALVIAATGIAAIAIRVRTRAA